jgi:hypothetical protein
MPKASRKNTSSNLISIEEDEDLFPVLERLSKDQRVIAQKMSSIEVVYIVGRYYDMQKARQRLEQQTAALNKAGNPSELMQWLEVQQFTLEKFVAIMLDEYSKHHPIGIWARSNKGIGPIIAAGILASFDIEKAPTAGNFHAFAGLDPTKKWLKGQKRPWNADLKRLCWLLGQAFVKASAYKDSFYSDLWLKRKNYEWNNNEQGRYASYAVKCMTEKKFGEDTESIKWYTGQYCGKAMELVEDTSTILSRKTFAQLERIAKKIELEHTFTNTSEKFKKKELADAIVKTGYNIDTMKIIGLPATTKNPGIQMLPPGQIQERSKRWAVKMFLNHLHQVWYEKHYNRPIPGVYPITIGGHSTYHYIPPPNFESKFETESWIRPQLQTFKHSEGCTCLVCQGRNNPTITDI